MDAILLSLLTSPITPVTLALGTVAVMFFLLFTGRLLPRGTVELLLTAERLIAQNYKDAWEAEKARNDLQSTYLESLLTYAETANKILNALPVKTGTIPTMPAIENTPEEGA